MNTRESSAKMTALSLLTVILCSTLALGAEEIDRKIAPADTISVEVFGEKDLTVEVRVQAGGTIKYPLLGSVPVAGLTTAQVADLLEEKLGKDFLVNPSVIVNVKDYRLNTVSVLGYVYKGGAIKLPAERPMDLLEAIAEAGGFQPTANKKKIELNRNGKIKTYKFDELRKETDPKKKIWLEPGDVIYVPDTLF